MSEKHFGEECHGILARGEKYSKCGASKASVEESLESLYNAQAQPFKQFAEKFRNSEKELTAMIDINFRINYKGTQRQMDEVVRRIQNGELPSDILRDKNAVPHK